MSKNDFICSGEGYFFRNGDPSQGFYGIPLEVEEQRMMEWKTSSIQEESKNNLIVIKALKLLRESQGNGIDYKINLLERLGYSRVKTSNGYVKFRNLIKRDYSNLSNMYERTIKELREIVKNPNRKSKLVDRLNFQ